MKTKLMFMVAIMIIAVSCDPKEDDPILPAPTADFSANKTAIIAGETVDFNGSVTNAVSISWEFTGGNPATSSETSPTVVYAIAGKYSVTLTAIGGDGQIAKVTKDTLITVDSPVVLLPIADFTADNTVISLNKTVKFTDQSNNGPFTSYLWTFEGGLTLGDYETYSTEVNPEVWYNTAGKFKVTLRVFNQNGENTIVKDEYITVIDDRIKIYGFIKNLGDNITLNRFDIGAIDSQGFVIADGTTSTFGENNSYEIFISRDYLGKTLNFGGFLHFTNAFDPDSNGTGVAEHTITLQETNVVDWVAIWQ